MVLWLLTLLLSPAPSTTQVVVSLAVVAAGLLILLAAAAAGVAVPVRPPSTGAPGRRAGPRVRPRLADPDAAGRPRPRAPSGHPATA